MIGEQSSPVIKAGGNPLNLDSKIPDDFLARTGAISTIFARRGDDFIRVTTSLKKQDGTRAIGTLLDNTSPAYVRIMAGNPSAGWRRCSAKNTSLNISRYAMRKAT